jgi:hypothetical protein
MIISIINHTNLKDEDIHHAIRVVNRQIEEDFEPYWSLGAKLRLEGRGDLKPEIEDPSDMRGDAIIYMWDDENVENALGYHDQNHRGIPFGFVFTRLSESLGESWTVTLSHEALELIADPEVNLLVAGPHPTESIDVFHWYEMCDAVQAETYKIDEIDVSNFVLPLYFTGSEELGGRNDFLRRHYDGKTLESFKVNPGGYIGFFNPVTGQHETYSMKGDKAAQKRIQIKSLLKCARRAIRYQRFEKGKSLIKGLPHRELIRRTARKHRTHKAA